MNLEGEVVMPAKRNKLAHIEAGIEARLDRLLNIEQFREAAMQILSPSLSNILAYGSADELTLAGNQDMLSRLRFVPRLFNDVATVSTEITLMGETLGCPVIVSPTNQHRAYHVGGEIETAQAASTCNTLMILSTGSTTRMEEIPQHCHHAPWYQLTLLGNAEVTKSMVTRAQEAGFASIVLTADIKGVRLIYRLNTPPKPQGKEANVISEYEDLQDTGVVDGVQNTLRFACTLTSETLDWIRSLTDLPIMVKGVLHPKDVELCLRHGVSGIVVSNHGGRVLDGCISTIEALTGVVSAAQGEMSIILDGGIRRGSDVFKALALGADAVGIGRPCLYGLTVGGAKGVERVLKILEMELRHIMRQTGFSSIAQIKESGRDCLDFSRFSR